MKIQGKRQLRNLQEDFNEVFPYLKIEFFKTPHSIGNDSDEKEILDVNLRISEVQEVSKKGEMLLDEEMSVGDFEEKMRNDFGLNIQVYRKEHGKWLQTWVTDSWTLEHQNNRSKVMGDKDDLLVPKNPQ